MDRDHLPRRFEDHRRARIPARRVGLVAHDVARQTEVRTSVRLLREVLTRRLRGSGFIIFDHIAEFPAAATELTQLAARKEIVFDEEILIGLEQAPRALASLYEGANRGKLIVSLVG